MPNLARFRVFDHIQKLFESLDLAVDKIDPQNEFTILNLNAVSFNLPYQSPVFRVNYFVFVFVRNAQGCYTTDDLTYSSQPGTIYFHNPGHTKTFAWQQIDDVYVVSVSEAFLKEHVRTDVFDVFPFLLAETIPPCLLRTDDFAELDQLCQQLFTEYKRESPYRNQIIGNLFTVILLKIKIHCWQEYNPVDEGNRSSQIVKTFKSTLEEHFRRLSRGEVSKGLRVQDLADIQHLHPNYLSDVIRIKTGKSIGTWIAEKTITEAKVLLTHSSLSVREIAYRLGFGESTHFSAYFKKYMKVTPVLYRQQQLKTSPSA